MSVRGATRSITLRVLQGKFTGILLAAGNDETSGLVWQLALPSDLTWHACHAYLIEIDAPLHHDNAGLLTAFVKQ